jgi:hypothetical protein
MALPVILANSFNGWVDIVANTFKQEKLQEYIDLFVENYIRLIIGDAAFMDIRDQTRQKWTDLLAGVDYVGANGKRRRFSGLNTSLKYFIYFEFVRDNFTSTQAGKTKNTFENSTRAGDLEVLNTARLRFNQGVLLVNGSTPPFLEANDEFTETATGAVDNADNTYTLSIQNTKYLEVGDVVTVNGEEYTATILNVDTDVTFDAGATGLDFSGASVIWEPFEDVDFCKMGICGI